MHGGSRPCWQQFGPSCESAAKFQGPLSTSLFSKWLLMNSRPSTKRCCALFIFFNSRTDELRLFCAAPARCICRDLGHCQKRFHGEFVFNGLIHRTRKASDPLLGDALRCRIWEAREEAENFHRRSHLHQLGGCRLRVGCPQPLFPCIEAVRAHRARAENCATS